ncbi:MAG: (2Fe-2S)-binding protein [Oscillospiraceae bacterium]|jgi:xanthine dehydrogenase YagT iron-sulfur-binding subunit|nr:(2Fe-2S)-binding protein [Oscillospiraceae bacterium]
MANDRISTSITAEAAHQRAADLIAAVPSALAAFRCPLCNRDFGSYDALIAHYGAEHPTSVLPVTVTLDLNGKLCDLLIEPHWTLQRTLQFRLGLTGAKHMCDRGVCGSCTVIADGRPILACQVLAVELEDVKIQTVEGIAADPKWKPLIDAYCKWDAMQCGYCTPGFLVTAKALLDRNPHPSEQDCKEALAGNICICGTYPRHSQAILEAAMKIA